MNDHMFECPSTSRNNRYGTHLPTIGKYLKEGDSAVEFGCGMFSTEAILSRCGSLLSLEMQEETWLNKMREKVGHNPRWTSELCLGGLGFLGVTYPGEIDFALVDGHAATRPECINLMMQFGVPTIVTHDTEHPGYGWERVNCIGYTRIDYKEVVPWSTVWLKSESGPSISVVQRSRQPHNSNHD